MKRLIVMINPLAVSSSKTMVPEMTPTFPGCPVPLILGRKLIPCNSSLSFVV